MLDDFHFKNAGLTEDQLHGYYLTEDDGRLLSVFPGSERLRYMIPFRPPQETIDYLGTRCRAASRRGRRLRRRRREVRHLAGNEEARLRRRLAAPVSSTCSWPTKAGSNRPRLAEAIDNTPPVGKIYLPDGSYREMTEWALPTEQLAEYEQVRHEMEHDPRWPRDRAVRARRLLAELQGEVSRSRRDVHAA